LIKNKFSQTQKRNRGTGEKMGGKSVRTVTHGRHVPNIPCGEITIEVTSFVKHCTTRHTANKEKTNDKNGLDKKKRREDCSITESVHVLVKGRRE